MVLMMWWEGLRDWWFARSDERRRFQRINARFKVMYREPVTQTVGTTYTSDISRRGIRFPLDHRLPRGAILDLHVQDDDLQRSWNVRGRIAWVEEFVTGNDGAGRYFETGVRLRRGRLL